MKIILTFLALVIALMARADLTPGMKGDWSLNGEARSDTAGVVTVTLTTTYACYTVAHKSNLASFYSYSEGGVQNWTCTNAWTFTGTSATVADVTWRMMTPGDPGQVFAANYPQKTLRNTYNDGIPLKLNVLIPAGWTVDLPTPKAVVDDVTLDLVTGTLEAGTLKWVLPEIRLEDPLQDPIVTRLTHRQVVTFTMRRL